MKLYVKMAEICAKAAEEERKKDRLSTVCPITG
jgi:hypothetical protein